MNENECKVIRELYDERFERDKERIEKLETLTTKVSECCIKLNDMVEAHNEKILDHDKRIQQIEARPANWWDKVISGAISAIVALIVGIMFNNGGV